MLAFEVIKVETYFGHKADSYPRSFQFQNKTWDIEEIEDRWYEGSVQAGGPVMNYFKVRTTSSQQFILRHNLNRNIWAVKIA